jgi:hypothetical protein
MSPHVPKPGAGDTGPRGVRIADGEYGSPITSQCMPVDKIRIGKRHRKDTGDLDALAVNIDARAVATPLPRATLALLRDAHGHASTPLDAATAECKAMR